MSELIGSAELEVGTDLAPLDAGLADAKVKAAKAVAELQAIFDRLHIGVNERGGLLSDALSRRLSEPLANLGDGAEAMASQWNAALDSVRASITHTAEVTVAASEVEVAAIDKVTAAYLEQAAAARAAGDAAVGRGAAVDVLAGSRGGEGPVGAAFATREQRGGAEGLTAAELATLASMGVEGVRGKGHAGSRVDPLVVVLEAGRYTPLGGMSAAVGYQGLSGAATTTVAQGGSQGGATNVLSSSRTPGEPPVVVPGASGDRSRPVQDAALAAGLAKLTQAMERPLTAPAGPSTVHREGELPLLVFPGEEEAAQRDLLAAKGGSKSKAAQQPIPVVVTDTETKAAHAEGAATAAALADLATRGIGPGQRAKTGAGYRAAYEALGYTVASRVPGGPARLYAPGGEPGTGNYGLTAEAAALAASHGGGGGGGLPPWLMPMLWGHAGGGGGGGGRLGGLLTAGGALAGFGSLGSFAGFGPEHLLLTAGGIAGSGVAALGGGALLGAGAAGKVGVGMGSDAAVMSSTIADTKQLYSAYENVNKAIRVYGKGSEQAQVATAELNSLFVELGNTAGMRAEEGVAHAAMALNQYWDKATSGARVQASKILMQVLELGRAYIPLVAKAAEQNFSATNTGLKPLFEWLKGPEGMGIFLQLENEFRQEIPAAMKALDMGVQFFGKTIAAVSPDTGAFIGKLDEFFTKMDEPAHFAHWETMMGHMIGDFHTWGDFLKILGIDIVDLFNKDADTGKGIIEVLTHLLDKVHEWEDSTKGSAEIHNIFTLHKEEVIALIEALSLLVAPFKEVYVTLAPPMVKAMTGIAEAVAFVVTKVEDLGGMAKWIIGLTLVAAKLKVLGPLLKAVAVETNLLSAAEDKNAVAVLADSEGNLRLAGSEGAVAAGGVAAGAGSDTSLLGKVGVTGGGLSGDLKGTLIKGGLEAGGGALVANVAATALGIKGTSNTALTAAGAGAGLGFAFGGPFGAAVGAGLGGGLVEAINLFTSHAPSYGKKFADKFAAPLEANLARTGTGNEGPGLTAALAKQRDATDASRKALREYEKEHEEAERAYKPSAGEAGKYHAEVASGYNKLFNKNFSNEAREGAAAAELLKKAFEGVPHKTTWAFTSDLISQLKLLSGQARNTAAETMLMYARELETQGKLPRGAVAKMLKSLEDTPGFSGLAEYFKEHALGTSAAFVAGFDLKKASENLAATLERMRTEWGLFNADPTVTGKNWVSNAETEMRDFRQMAASSTGSARDEVLLHMHELGGGIDSMLNNMLGSVRSSFQQWAPAMHAGIGPAVGKAGDELSKFEETVGSLMESGVISVQTGSRLMGEAVNAYLKAMGAAKVGLPRLTAPGVVSFLRGAKAAHPGELPELRSVGHAQGGLLQIGRPGEAGHDSVPLNVGGLPIMVAPGEQVAVFNRHQLPVVNAALAGVGGLPGLFSQVTTPNYMASGGIVAPHVGGFGAIPELVRGALKDVANAANEKLGSVYPAPHGAHAGASGAGGGGRSSAGGQYNRSELEGLWRQAGGSPSMAHVMAAIALAESSGNAGAESSYSDNGSHAQGLWQIEMPMHASQVPGGNAFNALANARGAVAILASQGLGAWETYTSGAYQAYMARGGILGFDRGGLLGAPLAQGLGFARGGHMGFSPKAESALHRIWKAAAPYFHRSPSSPYPATKVVGERETVGLLGTESESPHSSKWVPVGKRNTYIPEGFLRSPSHEGLGINAADPRGLAAILFEWTHHFQRQHAIEAAEDTPEGRRLQKAEYLSPATEGGSQAWLEAFGPRIFAAAGLQWPGGADGGTFSRDAQWVRKALGSHWVSNTQFGFARGGFVGGNLAQRGLRGFARGGSVPKRAKALPKGQSWRVHPFGKIPPVKTSWWGQGYLDELNSLMGSGGSLAGLTEQYGLEETADELALTKAPHAGAFVVQPNALEKAAGVTLPYEDAGNVQLRSQQLGGLSHTEYGVLNDLTEAWNLSSKVLSAAHDGVQERNKAIAELKARIAANLKRIKECREAIKRQEDQLKKLPTGKHATAASRAQAAKLHKEIADEHSQIKSLEDENARLGGNRGEIGTGGSIGTLVAQRTELHETKTATEGYVQEIGGASGKGGKRAETQDAIAKLAQQMVELGETPLREKEALLEGGSGPESALELSEREKTQHQEKEKALEEKVRLQADALSVFGGPGDIGVGAANAFAAATRGGLFTGFGPLPFAGHFDTGGIVPGPIGQAAVAVVHGGEEVRTPAQQAAVHFEPHYEINTLHPGDPTVLNAIGRASVKGINLQGLRRSKRWKPGV